MNIVHDVRGHEFACDVRRVVSLVPSITETIFDLGRADRLIARTDYCVHPVDVQSIRSIGGTKNPDLNAICALQPDLVFANQEENARAIVDALEAAGIDVFLTFPRSVNEALSDLKKIGALLGAEDAAREFVASIEDCMQTTIKPETRSVFVPVWRESHSTQGDVWMTFNADTFAHDLLLKLNLTNIFAQRERRYPLAADLNRAEAKSVEGRDTRYPRVTLDEVVEARPQLVLLPDEPYVFGESDAQDLVAALTLPRECIHLIDGSLLFWHGTRLLRAWDELRAV